jgi:putative transposase
MLEPRSRLDCFDSPESEEKTISRPIQPSEKVRCGSRGGFGDDCNGCCFVPARTACGSDHGILQAALAIRNRMGLMLDHRLRQLVTLAGPAAVNDVSVPRSTVATWRKRGARQVASSHLFEVGDTELRARLVTAERRLLALRALMHLLLVLVRVRGARLMNDRLPDGRDKQKLLAAVGRATKVASRRRALALVGLTEVRFRAWARRQGMCTLDDRSSCPKLQPRRLTRDELSCMRTMAESADLQHMPVSVLSAHAQRIGRVFASASTWARMIRKNGWRRPRKRIHPRPSRIGIRAQRIGELLHIDVTVIRLLDWEQ